MKYEKSSRKLSKIILVLILTFSVASGAILAPDLAMAKKKKKSKGTNYGLNDKYAKKLWGVGNVQVASLWKTTKGSPEVIVAVVDTGVDYNHEDLAGNIWINSAEISGNGVDDDNNGYIDDMRGWDFHNNDNDPMDDNGHGTSVAGVIAATGNNKRGVAGIAMNSKIMVLKCLGADRSGNANKAAEAIRYAADNGAKIINLSWTSQGESAKINGAVDYAIGKGLIVVVAAGNHNADVSGYFPANNSSVITVAAINDKNRRASFSNWGDEVDISAPGVGIQTTFPGNKYRKTNGTSVATGYVSGLAALLISQYPDLSAAEVKGIIFDSGDDLGSPGRDGYFGAGRINGVKMMQNASNI